VAVCDTTHCTAGWGVALTSQKLYRDCLKGNRNWFSAGRGAFGLDTNEAKWLFYDVQTEDPNLMARVLRKFAQGEKLEDIQKFYARKETDDKENK
jgi:hypothetical protein